MLVARPLLAQGRGKAGGDARRFRTFVLRHRRGSFLSRRFRVVPRQIFFFRLHGLGSVGLGFEHGLGIA